MVKAKEKETKKEKDTEKAPEPGQELLSYCGKCKEPTIHTIISLNKKGGADKCQCKTCKAKHKYRDPDKPTKTRAKSKRSVKKSAASAQEAWNEAIAGAKGPSKAYAMGSEFAEGDLIDHSTFGQGVVSEIMGGNKIKVIFETDEKVLVHNREMPQSGA